MTELVSHIMEFVAAKRDMTDLYPRLLAPSGLSLVPRFSPGEPGNKVGKAYSTEAKLD